MTARSTVDTRKLDPTSIIVFNQASVLLYPSSFITDLRERSDVGEYLRDEVRSFSLGSLLREIDSHKRCRILCSSSSDDTQTVILLTFIKSFEKNCPSPQIKLLPPSSLPRA